MTNKSLLTMLFTVAFSAAAYAQNRTVSGTVTGSDDGLPLPQVSVLLKGTTTGVPTNIDGEYRISVPESGGTLVFSFLGYVTQEVEIGNRTVIDVVLEPDVTALGEVVVVGYGTQKKATLTGSTVTVNAEDLALIPTGQISNTLAGRAQGVQIINNSGFAGSNSSINIRGTNIGALYVIDNVISDKSQFDVLDANEIESISFLKDAATAAIYGARAAGGVVVVTTKTGKKGKVKFTYSSNFSISKPTMPLPDDVTAEDEVRHTNNSSVNNGRQPIYGEDVLAWAKKTHYPTINDMFWRDATTMLHNLTLSGGSEKVKYFFSGSFNENNGNYKRTNFNKYNLRARVDADISENLTLGTNISYNRRKTKRFLWPYDGDNGEGFTVSDFYRTTFNQSRLRPLYAKKDGTPTTADDPEAFPIDGYFAFNPGEIIRSDAYRDISYNTFNTNLNLDYKLKAVKGLTFSVLGNYRQDNFNRKDFILHNISYVPQPLKPGSSGPEQFILGPINFNRKSNNNLGRSFQGIDENVNLSERYQLNAFVKYNNTFGKHAVNGLLGYEQMQQTSKSLTGRAQDLLSNKDQILATSQSAERRFFGGGEGNSARVSYLGRVNYIYDEKYIAEFSFRRDGSYKFPKAKRFGFFPSASVAWRLSEEGFFNVPFVSNLKIRASLGSTGFDGTTASPDPIAPFQFQNNYRLGGSYLFGNGLANGITIPARIPNPNITWETHRTTNLGFDLGLFDGAWTVEADFFTNNIGSVLASRVAVIPGTFGSGLPQYNIAERKINGFEMSVNYKGNIGDKISFSLGANMGYAKDKWTKYPEAENTPDINSRIGRPNNRLVGYISKGIIRDQATLDALPPGFTQFGRKPALGDILFEDINGTDYKAGPDGKIDAFDRAIISENTVPRINYGLNGEFKYEGFSLSFLLQGVAMYDKHVRTRNTGGSGVFQFPNLLYFSLWKDAYSPDNPNGKYPRTRGWGFPETGFSPSTFWERSGAYIRLKNLTLAYQVPESLLNPLGVEGLSLFVNGANLFVLSAFGEHDPEQDALDSFPVMRSFSGGIRLTF